MNGKFNSAFLKTHISLQILHTNLQNMARGLSSGGPCTSIHTLPSYKHFYWCKDNNYVLNKHVIFQVSVKMEHNFLCHTINEFSSWDSPALIVHTRTHFPHITVHILQNIMTHDCKNIINDMLWLTTDTSLFSPYIHDANNKCSLVGQLLVL